MKNVLYQIRDRIAIITINRPAQLNAVDIETYNELSQAFLDVRDDKNTRVAIITGAGSKAFSAGFDLASLKADKPFPIVTAPTIMRGLKLKKPVIAAVNGLAFGGGMEIVAACDLAIASENAVFSTPEVAWGLIPGWGGTQRLPRTLAYKHAAELLLTGNRFSAADAYRIGLINKIVPAAELMAAAEALANKICENAPPAVEAAKEAMIEGLNMTLDEGLHLELTLDCNLWETPEAKEGVKAFNEKRKPNYNKIR